ncbi:unnamed protein product [Rotaria sordida]|uniref:non-specific serine/threonine protein kinase n=1 Tax=Rotaria sordida TaxID=392033 RepID=A0A813P4E6_9BILA|nr:unnamed protein product [Rotaria sordida]CAF0737675.1 unnamed protein product [Rotaria sordida]CAF0746570.1 unnamed protein product [Rotaria sordida]CAF0749686.1 unnamed protein product [Rotaria sordida]CAF0816768.1 unnamed protein product [Rotaria sordida]
MCTPRETAQILMYANRYQQIKKLGQGSFGTAYLVHDTKSKHEKKVIKAIFIGDVSPNESLDAEHEASILARLRHPNIVRFYDSFIDQSYFCIVTEYCEDGDLDQLLKSLRKQRSRLQMDQVIDLFIQLLSAINFLHSKKILHRDIKTSNIFLKRNYIKLGDFGISRLMINTLDKASTFIGTPYYMSPESLRYDGYSMTSDIWSLGCVLYELSVCKRAFERSNIIQTMDAILRESPPALPERFPVKIQQLYLQMLSKEPEKRLKASELLDEFSKIEIKANNTKKLATQSSTPDPESKSSHRDLHRSYSNSPTINNRIHNSLQVPSSSVHSASSTDSIDCFENNPADNIPVLDNNIDPFSSTAKQIKTDYYRSKAQELIGSENFSRIYNYLHEQHKEQSEDPTRTDNIILSGLQALSTNSHACTLINELVLHECLNELNERTETS